MKARFIDYLRQKYDDRLRTVIEHVDEAHPHLHFYLIPRVGEAFEVVHPGYQASRKVRRDTRDFEKEGYRFLGGDGSDEGMRGPGFLAGAEYRAAMQKWQDDIYSQVCQPFGLQRISENPQRRVTRAESKRNKQHDANIKALNDQIEDMSYVLAQKQQASAEERAALNAELAQLRSAMSQKAESEFAGQQHEIDAKNRSISTDANPPPPLASQALSLQKENGQPLVPLAGHDADDTEPADDSDNESERS